MKRSIILLGLLILLSPLAVSASSKKSEAKVKEVDLASDEKMAFVSGENVSFDGRDLEINAYLINRSNYIKIRDVAAY